MMEVVIKIPEEEYRIILLSDKTVMANCASKESMMYTIKNGTPLPKGHGRLIDADELITKLKVWDHKANGIPNYAWKCIKDAQTIIVKSEE